MSVFVIVAVAAAFMALGGAGVAAVQLRRHVQRLASTARDGGGRLKPLTDELEREIAVAGAESEALQERIEAARREPRGRSRSPGRAGS